MSEGDLPILRPLPRRTFQFTPASNDPSPSDSPPTDEPDSSKLQASEGESKLPPSRTMSILNLTSSTLFGIYSDATTRDDISMGNTPWGTGSQTPATPGRSFLQDQRSPVIGAMERGNRREHSSPNAHRHGQTALAVLLRSILLFAFGMAYGVIVSHLQDNQHLIPVRVGGVDRDSLAYLIFWGTAGVGLGTLLPWVDILWEQPSTAQEIRSAFGTANGGARKKKEAKEVEDRERGDWNPVVRSVGAFMGVAFAIVSAILCFFFSTSNDVLINPSSSAGCLGNQLSKPPLLSPSSIQWYGT